MNEPIASRFPGAGGRKPLSMSSEDLVEVGRLAPDQELPLLVRARSKGLDLVEWARGRRDFLEEKLSRHGGILFRDFAVGGVERFEEMVRAVADRTLEYKERSSPRSQVQGNVYTSTDYPPSQPIFLHNENSYQDVFPLKIFFYCVTEPEDRGATPIADTRAVYRRIDPAVRDRFAREGWMYVRNFGQGFGLPLEEVFGTTDREQIDAYCRQKGIETEWKPGGGLRTRARRPAVSVHPKTGEPAWFNHATFFHVSTLDPALREALLDELDEEDLPTNTHYGDGSGIEPAVLDHLRAAYAAETVRFDWRREDVLMLDNMLVAHGREPFSGPRKIVVAMAEPCSWNQLPEVAQLP